MTMAAPDSHDKGRFQNLFNAEAAKNDIPVGIWQGLASRGVFVFDTDDTLYRMDSGLHDGVKARICKHANASQDLRARAKEWIGEDRDFRPQDLGTIFPIIVMEYNRKSPQLLESYFEEVYGNDYTKVAPDPQLVEAVLKLERAGKRIVLYTNGPSSLDPAKDFHVQKVLKRLGFDNAFVDRLRGNSYDLVMSVMAGAGKPTKEGLDNFLRDMHVDPADAVFFDDGVKNLKTGVEAGMKGVWTWTTKTPPDAQEFVLAEKLGLVLVGDTGFAADNIARALPVPSAPSKKTEPKIN